MELLTRCRDLALPFYVDLLKSAQQTLRERLLEQAEQAAGPADQRIFREASERLSACNDAMQRAFEERLRRGYRLFLEGREREALEPQADAAGREQLEDDLAISLIVSRANTQHAEALWQLNRRLAALRGGRPVADDGNPFGPALVGAALRDAMAELTVASKVRIFIYRHLGKLLLAVFGRVYAALNETLAAAGVLPNLRFKRDPAPAPEEPPPAAPAAAPEHRAYAAVLERLQRQRSGPRTHTAAGISYGGLATGREGAAANFQPLDYALVLSALQQSPEFTSGAALLRPLAINAVEDRLFKQLGRQARAEARHQVGEHDADTVDLVGMIFRYMLDDPKLPDLVKSLLSHLHTPYLKLALLDGDFLKNETHPARQLLDRMAETGARWVVDDKERLVLPKLRSVVETVLRGFVDDGTLFERLLEDFNGFCDGLDKRAEAVEKRNREAQEGIERLTQAKTRAAQVIAERLRGNAVPAVVLQLLQQPWTDFLVFNHLRNGEDSLSWKAALKVVDSVLWSVQSDPVRSREDLERQQNQLDEVIAEGLRTIGYRSEGAEELLRALREAQELAFTGQAAPALANVEEVAADAAVLDPAAQECAELLRSQVDFGTWFEFDRPGQPPALLKLAWFSRVSGHYMFVNQAGVKQAVETLPGLAQSMAEGRVRLAQPERKSFVERALTAVLGSLRSGG